MFTVVLNLLLNWLFVFYFELGSHGEYCLFIYFSPDNKAFFFSGGIVLSTMIANGLSTLGMLWAFARKVISCTRVFIKSNRAW